MSRTGTCAKNFLALRASRVAAALCLLAIGLWLDARPAQARGESPYCASLKAQIARAGDGGGGRFRAAALKQRAELNRTAAYARGIGCDRQQFLIFGDAPPPQCGQLQARIAQMSANLANLQQSEAGGGNKAALLARYDAECRDRPPPPQEKNILEELFGSAAPVRQERLPPPAPSREDVRDPFDDFRSNTDVPDEQPEEKPRGGSLAICVRQCDGGFFPVSYSARNSNLEHLNDLCRALCPNTEARLYTKSPWRDVDTAVSMDGESYADHPNALKFQKQRIAGCGCMPPGKSWVDSLEEAERLLAESNGRDQMVTPEEAERLSRPSPIGAVSNRRDAKNRSTRRDAPPLQTATTVPPAESETNAASVGAQEQSVFREFTGPDGVRRRVRVIAPTL